MMYTSRFYCLLLLFAFSFLSLKAQFGPVREMRGVWVATVMNIDYPSVSTTSDFVLRNEWIAMIDKHKAMGINALFVQIRPMPP